MVAASQERRVEPPSPGVLNFLGFPELVGSPSQELCCYCCFCFCCLAEAAQFPESLWGEPVYVSEGESLRIWSFDYYLFIYLFFLWW